jgi:hypothetical protein
MWSMASLRVCSSCGAAHFQRHGHVFQAAALVVLQCLPVHAQACGHAGGQAGHGQIGQAGEGAQHVHQRLALRGLAENVQAVADLRRAQFAQIAVDVLDQVGHVHALHLGQRQRHAVGIQRVIPFVGMVVVVIVVVMIMVVVMMAVMVMMPMVMMVMIMRAMAVRCALGHRAELHASCLGGCCFFCLGRLAQAIARLRCLGWMRVGMVMIVMVVCSCSSW